MQMQMVHSVYYLKALLIGEYDDCTLLDCNTFINWDYACA